MLRKRHALERGSLVLQAQGFTNVVNLRGGVQAWRAENLPLVKEGGGKSRRDGTRA